VYSAAHADAKSALEAWFDETAEANWAGPPDIQRRYPSSDVMPHSRVVFKIKGNIYRFIVKIHYNTGIVMIRFVSTHAEYDKIDATTV
jgi:mRNA interferase HigB